MNPIKIVRTFIKSMFNLVGLDLVRIANSPRQTICGLKALPFRTVIDVGANKGQFAKVASKVFPDAKIFSFEPLPGPFAELELWAVSQGGRVETFNLALGEAEGHVEMLCHTEHDSSSSFLKTTDVCEDLYPFTIPQKPVKVEMSTLDRVVSGFAEPPRDDVLIKLDVQGYEDRVIKGGMETFKNAKACILEVSLDKLYENQATFKDILLYLYDLGFHYAGNLEQKYGDDGHVIFLDSVFVK